MPYLKKGDEFITIEGGRHNDLHKLSVISTKDGFSFETLNHTPLFQLFLQDVANEIVILIKTGKIIMSSHLLCE
jgi:hypothetical protein